MTRRAIPVAIAMLGMVACGAVHGLWTERWGLANDASTHAARLQQVSADLGDWHGTDMDEVPTQPEPLAGHLFRRYTNRKTGVTVVVALMCGRPGPVSIHSPDACYPASGFEMSSLGHAKGPELEGQPESDFMSARMNRTRGSDQTSLQMYWGWSADGRWQAPADPRLTFASAPVLYKLYVIRELQGRGGETSPEEPGLDLMRQLLPELQRTLFAQS